MSAGWLVLEIAGGGLAGAVALSLLTMLTHWLFVPEVFRDGLYCCVWVVTIPVGAVLGAVTTTAVGYTLAHEPHVAAGIAGAGGSAIALLCLAGGCFPTGGTEGPRPTECLAGVLFGYGVAVVWALALIGWGLSLAVR